MTGSVPDQPVAPGTRNPSQPARLASGPRAVRARVGNSLGGTGLRRTRPSVLLLIVIAVVAVVLPATLSAPPPAPVSFPRSETSAMPPASRPLPPATVDPVRGTAAACETRRPPRATRATVALSAGHGVRQPRGAHETAVIENTFSTEVVNAVATRLQRRGFTTVVSQSVDTNPASNSRATRPLTAVNAMQRLMARAECADPIRVAARVSVHLSPAAKRSLASTPAGDEDPRAPRVGNPRLARTLQNGVAAELAKLAGRPISPRVVAAPATTESVDDYLAARGTTALPGDGARNAVPGALIEPAFATSPADAALLRSARGTGALAQGIASSLERFISENAPPRAR